MSKRNAFAHFFMDCQMTTITLGGRKFKPCTNSTIEHQYVTMDRIRAAGLDVLDYTPGTDPDTFVAGLLGRLAHRGAIFELLGCMLIPAELTGADWTPELADETAHFIKRLTSAEDKQTVQAHVVSLLIDFFQAGLASLTTFPSYSQGATAGPQDSQQTEAA